MSRTTVIGALTAEQAADLATNLLPGMLVGLLFLGLLLIGFRIGRRVPKRSIRVLETSLRSILRGDFRGAPEISAGDPTAVLASIAGELSDTLEKRTRRYEHRAVMVGQAFEQLGGRGLMVTNIDLTVIAAGEGLARLIGKPALDIEGQPAGSMFVEEGWRDFLVRVVEPSLRKSGLTGSLELVRADHSPSLPVKVTAFDTTLPAGGLAFLIEVESSPADDRENETGMARLDSEQLTALFSSLADGVLVVSEGRIQAANPAVTGWLGEPLSNTDLKDWLAAEDLFMVVDRVARAGRGESVEPFRCRIVPRRGPLRVRDVEIHAVPIAFEDRAAAALTLRDFGAERQARRRTETQRARLLAVVNAAADGILMLEAPIREDSDWRLSLLSSRARELLALDRSLPSGASEHALRGAIAHRFRDPAALIAYLDKSRNEPSREWLGAFELTGSSARSIEWITRPVRGIDGETFGRVMVLRDITRHREVERQLREDTRALEGSRESLQRAYEELTALTGSMQSKTDELDDVNRELRQLDQSRAQLISNISHELQTPLASIRGYTQMVLEGRLGRITDEQRRGLDKVLRNVDRMVELIGNLLAMARAEQTPGLNAEPIAPEPVIREVIERHQPEASRKQVEIEFEVLRPGLLLAAERDGLVQVLDNLIGNALKFHRAPGRVRVSVAPDTEESGRYAVLSVSDTGVGIPAEERERIFERFFRGRDAAGVAGSGIGLATVRAIVERHGGSIECESTYGSGTTFRVFWPLSAESGNPPAAA